MNTYFEIGLLPDPDFSSTILMNSLFNRVHQALAAHRAENIGISFPDWEQNEFTLGRRLRLHGKDSDLEKVLDPGWIVGMQDHVTVGAIAQVPPHVRHRVVRRVQAKSNPERERRRLMLRKNISAETARQIIPDSAAKRLSLPYLVLTSRSTGQKFRLFIEHLPLQEQAVEGQFGTYGLSPTATVPWF
jgi:CRISPR-associated endonuclease Csy4